MAYKHDQIQSAYKKLPPEIQSLIMSAETAEFTENAIKNLGLDQDQADTADSEILYAMCGLQPLDTAIENISKLSGKSIQELSDLKDSLYQEIFSKYGEFESEQKEPIEEPAPQQPIIITHESKSEALEELKRRRESAEEAGGSMRSVPPSNLPVLEPDFAKSEVKTVVGETAHEVAHVEPTVNNPQLTTTVSEIAPTTPTIEKAPGPVVQPRPATPQTYGYQGAKDPYREPLD